MNLIIRKAETTDAEEIILFQENMAIETEDIILEHDIIAGGVVAVFADKTKGQYYVAESNREVIGSLLITAEWSDWRNSYIWWFQSVYIKPAFRRKGIFREMYKYIRTRAGENNIAGLRLYVEKENTTAQNTYEAMGMDGDHYKLFEWLKE